MSRDTTVLPFRQREAIDDPLSELAREGARRMLAQVLIAEADSFVAMWKDLKLPDGRDRVVRHGHGPHRAIQTGVGPVEVRRAKVRDRGDVGAEDKIRFTSSILPKWARRTKSLDALLPVLYLRGVSTGDFQEALATLLGKDAPNLSPAVISRLTAEWQADYDAWQKRDLSARRYVYVWADGVYLQARMEEAAECMLVLIGATPEGRKELVGFQTGVRESAQSWRELLIDIKQRGLEIAPDLAVGDGALGFWKAIEQVFPSTRHQRCWVHKTANVLNKVALSIQVNMKVDLREIYAAPTSAAAEAAIDVFADKYNAKHDKAVACLTKNPYFQPTNRQQAINPNPLYPGTTMLRDPGAQPSAVAQTLLVGLVGLLAAGASAATLDWSAPARVDHRQPFATTPAIQSVACPTLHLCVGLEGEGVVTSVKPLGGATAQPPSNARATAGIASRIGLMLEIMLAQVPEHRLFNLRPINATDGYQIVTESFSLTFKHAIRPAHSMPVLVRLPTVTNLVRTLTPEKIKPSRWRALFPATAINFAATRCSDCSNYRVAFKFAGNLTQSSSQRIPS